MPELPEVETTLRAIRGVLEGRIVERLDIRRRDLRWPVTAGISRRLAGEAITGVRRRAKYLLMDVAGGTLIVHLGMSGSIRILPEPPPPPRTHDHIDLVLRGGPCLRYTDPRRFGAWVWTRQEGESHELLRDLGPEPWDAALTAETLHARAQGRKAPIKTFIMDNAVLVGVGNIYATEALFRSGIHPSRPAGRVSLERWALLLAAIREVLEAAIVSGGSTLRDFSSGEGKPGYFAQQLQVYGRSGLPCPVCGSVLRELRLGGRASAYCPHCQR